MIKFGNIGNIIKGSRYFIASRKPHGKSGGVTSVETTDAYELAIRVMLPQNPITQNPVILQHGLACNSQIFLTGNETSLAKETADSGFITFLPDLRGHGKSTGKRLIPEHNFDTFINYDLPAIIEYALSSTRGSGVHLVGHSMGGMIGGAYLSKCAKENIDPKVLSFTNLAGAETIRSDQALINFLLAGIALYEEAFNRTKLSTLNPITLGARYLLPYSGIIPDGLFLTLVTGFGKYKIDNVDPEVTLRYLKNGFERINPGVLSFFTNLIKSGKFETADGSFNYTDNFGKINVPALFVAGELDVFVPPQNLRVSFEKWGTHDKKFHAAKNLGHLGLLFGKDAKESVWAHVLEWQKSHNLS